MKAFVYVISIFSIYVFFNVRSELNSLLSKILLLFGHVPGISAVDIFVSANSCCTLNYCLIFIYSINFWTIFCIHLCSAVYLVGVSLYSVLTLKIMVMYLYKMYFLMSLSYQNMSRKIHWIHFMCFKNILPGLSFVTHVFLFHHLFNIFIMSF